MQSAVPDLYDLVISHSARLLLSGQEDSDKNNLAMDATGNLLAHSCRLNMHIVSPHGVVFEIRVSDGYGARWSEDGTQCDCLI
ncbi:hypothetical protein RJ640_027620 [Escallonia rubra]|uniref:Uncharacterized protein n=1 Tax=Escallonia rubra TaxID=112253 RepID=A0AA88UA03_9ASTE|nr:hypothetical protein RJ640_027620 [Escallonia rubra]